MFDRQPIGDDFTWMHSGQLGATKINTSNGAPNGQLLSILDACLGLTCRQFRPSLLMAVILF